MKNITDLINKIIREDKELKEHMRLLAIQEEIERLVQSKGYDTDLSELVIEMFDICTDKISSLEHRVKNIEKGK